MSGCIVKRTGKNAIVVTASWSEVRGEIARGGMFPNTKGLQAKKIKRGKRIAYRGRSKRKTGL